MALIAVVAIVDVAISLGQGMVVGAGSCLIFKIEFLYLNNQGLCE